MQRTSVRFARSPLMPTVRQLTLMTREILTYPLDRPSLEAELAFLVQHFRTLGYDRCTAFFGHAWGERYPQDPWTPVDLPLEALVAEVSRIEAAGFGALGDDDLFITLAAFPLEFRFCNDSDIHLSFEEPSDIAEVFYQRWRGRGYRPAEWGSAPLGQERPCLRRT